MAAPFLYRHIILGRARCIVPLRDALVKARQQAQVSQEGKLTAGWWTKRLDVSIRDAIENDHATFSALAGILLCLGNLEILTFSSLYDNTRRKVLPSEVLDSLTCGDSLKVVHWHTPTLLPTSDAWTALLERHKHLESIKSTVKITRDVRLNSLKTIYYMSGDVANKLVTPFLTQVMLDGGVAGLSRFDLCTFFSDTGAGLSLVEIKCTEYKTGFIDPFATILREITHHCDNLTQINLRFSDWDVLQSNSFLNLPERVVYLGITVECFQISQGATRLLFFYSFPNLVQTNPKLKVIQFLNKNNLQALRKHTHTFDKGVQELAKHVTVKDFGGNTLSISG